MEGGVTLIFNFCLHPHFFVLTIFFKAFGPLGEHLYQAIQYFFTRIKRQGFYLLQYFLVDKMHGQPPFLMS